MKFLLLAVTAIAVSVLLAIPLPVDFDKRKDLPPSDVFSSSGSSGYFSSPSEVNNTNDGHRYARRIDKNSSERNDKSVLNPSESSPRSSKTERIRRRSRRDTNGDFSTSVDKMSKISRVINGISIQQGLTKGVIKSDTLISEFLNLGSVTPSSVQNLNPDELKQLVTDIQNLPNKLENNPDIEKIETRFTVFDHILEVTKGIGEELKVEKQTEYQQAVDSLKDQTYIQDDLIKAVKRLGSFLAQLKSLEDDKKSNDGQTNLALVSCSVAYSNLIDMESFKKSLLKHEVLTDGAKMFGPLKRVHEAIEEFLNKAKDTTYMPNDGDIIEKVGENIKALSSLAKRAHSSSPSFAALFKIFIESRHLQGNRKLTLTSGFPNGYTELDAISNDLSDPWIQSVVDGQSEILSKALEPLKSLKKGLKSSKKSFVIEDTDSNVLSSVIDEIAELTPWREVLDQLVKEIANVKTTASLMEMAPKRRTEFNTMFVNVLKLSKHMDALQKVVEVTGILKEDKSKHMEKILGIVANPKPDTAFGQLDTLRKSPDFKYILDLVRGAEESIAILVPDKSGVYPQKVTELAKKISPNFKLLAPYLTELKPFLSNFNSLRSLPGIEQLGSAVRSIQDLRKTKFTSGSFDNVAAKIVEVKTSLGSLQNLIVGMKGKDEDSKVLVDMADVLKDSQTVGSATRVFRSMEKTDKNRLVVLDQLTAGLIQNKMKEMDPEDQKTLKQLLELDTKLAAVYGQVGGVKKSATSSPTSDLSSLHPIFLLAKNAPGTPTNFFEIGISVVKLSQDRTLTSDQQKALLEIKNKLDTLDSLGLDFARHHSAIDESKKALEQLDLFFASSSGPLRGNKVIETKEGNWFEKHSTAIIIFSIVIFIVIGVCGFLVWRKKKKTVRDEDSLSDDPEAAKRGKNDKLRQQKTTTAGKSSDESEVAKKGGVDNKKTDKTAQNVEPPKLDDPKGGEKKELTEDEQKNLAVWQLQEDKTQPLEIAAVKDAVFLIHCLEVFLIKFSHVINCSKKLLPPKIKFSKAQGMAKFFSEQFNPMDLETTVQKTESVKGKAPYHTHNIAFERLTRIELTYPDLFKKGAQYHANRINFANYFELVLMQGPQDAGMSDATHPKENTVGMFYDLIVGQRAQYVVCLTKFIEQGQKKCSDYIPFHKGDERRFENGKIVVKCISKTTKHGGDLVIRELLVKFDGEPEHRFTHIHYLGWPDHGVPKDTKVLIDVLNMVRKEINPVFVHCSAGIGRSGVIGLVFQCRVLLESKNGNFLLSEGFKFVRASRYLAVQTAEQYAFAFFLFFDWVASDINVNNMTPQAQKYYKSFMEEKKYILGRGFDLVLQDFEKKKSKGEEDQKKLEQPEADDEKALMDAEKRLAEYKQGKTETKKDEATLDKTMSNTTVSREATADK